MPLLVLAGLALLPAYLRADMATYGFNTVLTGPYPGPYYTVTVVGSGSSYNFGLGGSASPQIAANQVLFVFSNSGPGTIHEVYFQDGTLLSMENTTYQSAGVDFNLATASPFNPPGGTNVNPDFITHVATTTKNGKPATGWNGDNDPGNINGIDRGESLGILFKLQDGKTFNDVIQSMENALTNPAACWNANGTDKAGGVSGLRMAIHVANTVGGQSSAFMNSGQIIIVPEPPPVTPVPEPAAIILFSLGGLGMLAFVRRKRS